MKLGLVHPERFLDRFSRLFMKSYRAGLLMAADPGPAIVEAIRTHPMYQGVKPH